MNGARALDIARSSHGDARARTPWARNRSMTCSRARPRRSPSFADARTPARATASGDDFGAARSLVSAARRAAVDAGLRLEELASLRSALTGEMAAARRAEREMAKLRAKLHDAEADAHAAWAALDVERARVTTSKVASESAAGAEAAPAVDAMTPASSASPPSAFNLLSLVSPSLTRSPGHEAMETERAALDKVGLLDREKSNPIRLSGGEQQRLCIARAVVHRPSILLADEPTGNLDRDYAHDIMELFRSFNQVGVTVLVSAHDEMLMHTYGRRIIRLAQGHLTP